MFEDTDIVLQAFAASDTTKPLVTIEKPASGSILAPGTISVAGKASDNKGGSGVKVVEISVDGRAYKLAKPRVLGDWSTWSISIGVTDSGIHTIKAKATDRAGNLDWHTVTITTKSTPSGGGATDNIDPIVDIIHPSDDNTITGTSITVRGTASDLGGSGIQVVDVRLVDQQYIPATPRASGDWSTWSATFSITSGQYRFVARATDKAGNQEWDPIDITVNSSTAPPAPPSGSEDKFGVAIIYPDSTSRPDSWFMDMNNPNVNRKRFDVREDSSITKNADGSWKISDTQIRMNLYNKNGYAQSKIPTYDRAVLTQKGYMQDGDDWKNVELTMFVKLNSHSGTVYFTPYARSGWHGHDTAANGGNLECEGTGVKPRIYDNGEVAEVKEMWHNEGYAVRGRHDATGDLQGRWIGIKTVIYDVQLSGGKIGVKQELWINESGDPGVIGNWKKVVDGTDAGGFGTDGDSINCPNSRPDQPIFWGGPVVTYRWDNANNVDFKWFSAREIQPPT